MRDMKNSEVEWIGDIPAEWSLIRFKDRWNNKKEIAEALCKGVCEWYSVNYVNPEADITDTVPKAKYDEIVKERDAYKQRYDSLVISLTNLYESLK